MSRTLTKRLAAEALSVILAAALIIFMLYYPGSARSASWAESTSAYTWELVGAVPASNLGSSGYSYSVYAEGSEAVIKTTVDESGADSTQNYMIFTHSCTAPPETIEPGGDVSMTISLHVNIIKHERTNYPMAECQVNLAEPRLGADAWDQGNSWSLDYYQGYQSYTDQTYNITGTMPDSTNEGEEISIYFAGFAGGKSGAYEWRYRLFKNESDSTDPGSEPGSSKSGRKAVGKTFKKNGLWYKVLKGQKSVQLIGAEPNDNLKSAAVPGTVKVGGYSYKVTSIGKMAFRNNKKLTKVTIGKNVTKIGAEVFVGCSKLKTVTIGKNVSKIGSKAFYKCKNLKTITVKTTKLKKKNIGAKAFTQINKKGVVKCPKGKKKLYRTIFRAKGCPKTVKFK